MARIRSVHPDICISETMATLPAALERTFVRLWTYCDDEGRCPDNTRLIKAAIYPLHDEMGHETVDRELTDLADRGLIVRYTSGGVAVIQVVSWSEYQHPQRPRDSTLPAPDKTARVHVRDGSRTKHELYPSGEGEGEGVGDISLISSRRLTADEPEAAVTRTELRKAARTSLKGRTGIRNVNAVIAAILKDPEQTAELVDGILAERKAAMIAAKVAVCDRCDVNGIELRDEDGRTVSVRCNHEEDEG